MGHFLAEQRYGVNANCQAEQTDANGFGIFYCPNPPALTNHPHIDVLEDFIPTLQSDQFRWIPKGLMLDLIDDGEPVNFTHVDDQVIGYTIQNIFAALQSDISTPQQYRARLLQQNNNNQQVEINALFTSYGY